MNKIFSQYILIGIIGLCFLLLPQKSFAAQLNFVDISTGNEVTTLEVRINPEGKNINVVEGSVVFSGIASNDLIVEVNTNDSILKIWPTEPIYNRTEKMIHFVGGTPNGFTKQGTLFRINLSSTTNGILDVSWSGVKTYLNDGLGTEESTSVKSITIDNSNAKKGGDNQNKTINDINTKEISTGPSLLNNATILLLIIIFLIFFVFVFYVYKKFIKK